MYQSNARCGHEEWKFAGENQLIILPVLSGCVDQTRREADNPAIAPRPWRRTEQLSTDQ
jgi:hypothetical protein